MPIDNDYVKSMQAWLASNETTNEQTRNYIDFHEKEISIHTRLLNVYREIIEHDEKRFKAAKEGFEQYLAENSGE